MLGDRRLRDGEGCGKLFHRTVGKRQQVNNLPAGGIGDGFENQTCGVLHKHFLMQRIYIRKCLWAIIAGIAVTSFYLRPIKNYLPDG
jgi:hypothetical protein